jgi:TRAP-type C4-dicarboxylate transport system substrate-binding protein
MFSRSAALALFLSVLAPLAGMAGKAAAQVLTLKIAANVPPNSPWDIGLLRLAAEFDRISGGRVRLSFPQSARMASEEDNIRRLRLGLDGAMLSSQGLAEIYPDSLALSLPGFIGDDAEFDAALKAVKPLIGAKLADRYVLLALSKGGWIRYFSTSPIRYPADLAGLRISIDQGNDRESRLLDSMGARLVPGSIADFLLQIGSGSVDGICQSPIYIAALWFQLRGKLRYMSEFKVAPFVGAMVVDASSWEKVPEELRPELGSAVQDMADSVGRETSALEAEAIASMDGLKVESEGPDAAPKWAEAIARRRESLIAPMFSAEMLQAIDGALAAARASKSERKSAEISPPSAPATPER